jgi:hypothetical protein
MVAMGMGGLPGPAVPSEMCGEAIAVAAFGRANGVAGTMGDGLATISGVAVKAGVGVVPEAVGDGSTIVYVGATAAPPDIRPIMKPAPTPTISVARMTVQTIRRIIPAL